MSAKLATLLGRAQAASSAMAAPTPWPTRWTLMGLASRAATMNDLASIEAALIGERHTTWHSGRSPARQRRSTWADSYPIMRTVAQLRRSADCIGWASFVRRRALLCGRPTVSGDEADFSPGKADV